MRCGAALFLFIFSRVDFEQITRALWTRVEIKLVFRFMGQKEFFTFADKVKTFNFPPSVFLCSYDVCSLFTNVPLAETIEICANALYDSELTPPPFPRAVFVELMQTANSSVEFSFNNIMHLQIDGVAMGSPLGPSLANIFVGYYEALLFKRVNKPLMYYRYVDDTFTVFNDEDECNEFFSHLDSLHPSLRFTFEKEKKKGMQSDFALS